MADSEMQDSFVPDAVDPTPMLEALKLSVVTAELRSRILAVIAAARAHVTAQPKADGSQRSNWGGEAVSQYKDLTAKAQELGAEIKPFSDTTANKLIHKWWQAFLTTGMIHDGQRTGRPRELPEAAVAAALKYISETRPYTQAEANNSLFISSILETYDVTAETLWRRMHQHNHHLSRTLLVEYKHQFTRQEIDERIDQCVRWLRQGINKNAPGVRKVDFGGDIGILVLPPERHTKEYKSDDWLTNWAKSLIFVDEKTFFISPTSYHVWTVRDKNPTSIVVEDPRVVSKQVVIKYASAVNGVMGGILLKPLSGTKGLGYEHHKTYKTQRTGADAKSCTFEEFQDFIRDSKAKYKQLCTAKHVAFEPIFSWDNPAFHGSVADGDWKKEFRIEQHNFSQLPKYSPDMHCMVETSHAIICDGLQKDVNRHTPNATDTMDTYLNMLQTRFTEMLTPKWGMKALKRVFAKALPAILEADGRYANKQAR